MREHSDAIGTDERSRQILNERARLLAKPAPGGRVIADVVDVLTFALAHEHYAIEARYVREVIRLPEIAPVPRAPNILHGLCALRGDLLPIFDLRPFLNLAARNASPSEKVIIVGESRSEFGILIDDVRDVVPLDIQSLSKGAELELAFDRSYLRGVTRDALIVLDGRRLLEEQALFLK